MSKEEIRENLCKQLQLLVEKSKEADTESLIRLTEEINKIANTILINC